MKHHSVLAASLFVATLALSGCDQDRGSGNGQKTTGHIESAVGSFTGDSKLKQQGKKDEVVGGVKGAVGDLKDAVHDATH